MRFLHLEIVFETLGRDRLSILERLVWKVPPRSQEVGCNKVRVNSWKIVTRL